MIGNPMVMKKGGGQVYSIAATVIGLPNEAKAGEIVTCTSASVRLIQDSSGNKIPYAQRSVTDDMGMTAEEFYFVMPASDVTIS